MPKVIECKDISSYALAAVIYKNGAKVKVYSDSKLRVSCSGVAIDLTVNDDSQSISLSYEVDLYPPTSLSNRAELADVLNQQVLTLKPIALATLTTGQHGFGFALTVRSEMLCDSGLNIDYFLSHILRVADFIKALDGRLRQHDCAFLTKIGNKFANPLKPDSQNHPLSGGSLNGGELDNKEEIIPEPDYGNVTLNLMNVDFIGNKEEAENYFEIIKEGFIIERKRKMAEADPVFRHEMSLASYAWVEKWAVRKANEKIALAQEKQLKFLKMRDERYVLMYSLQKKAEGVAGTAEYWEAEGKYFEQEFAEAIRGVEQDEEIYAEESYEGSREDVSADMGDDGIAIYLS